MYGDVASFSLLSIVSICPTTELASMKTNVEKSSDDTSASRRCLNHSLYEWITLLSTLFVPLVVGILTIVLPLQQQKLSDRQTENSNSIALYNRLQDIELLHDQQKQTILNSYEQDLSDLILKYNGISKTKNSTNDKDDDDDEYVSLVIRMKTLNALRQLDPVRKLLLIQLLMDSGVQNRINISHADLSSLIFPSGSFYNQLRFVNIVARNISLKNIHLYSSNFSHSILDGSSLRESNCSYSDFSFASLKYTDWTNSDVTQAIFKNANFLGAKISPEQLITVQSLKGSILPNGTIVTST